MLRQGLVVELDGFLVPLFLEVGIPNAGIGPGKGADSSQCELGETDGIGGGQVPPPDLRDHLGQRG